jgi:hypothetical protein
LGDVPSYLHYIHYLEQHIDRVQSPPT